MTTKFTFEIESNFEVYCWLKSTLPSEYIIQAEPQTGYYSEWFYDYRIYQGEKLIKQLQGNFQELKDDQLVEEAKDLLKKLK